MTGYTDEIFGLVLCLVRADTYEHALTPINDNPPANGTAIFARDGGAARAFQFDVEVGAGGINVPCGTGGIPAAGSSPLVARPSHLHSHLGFPPAR